MHVGIGMPQQRGPIAPWRPFSCTILSSTRTKQQWESFYSPFLPHLLRLLPPVLVSDVRLCPVDCLLWNEFDYAMIFSVPGSSVVEAGWVGGVHIIGAGILWQSHHDNIYLYYPCWCRIHGLKKATNPKLRKSTKVFISWFLLTYIRSLFL